MAKKLKFWSVAIKLMVGFIVISILFIYFFKNNVNEMPRNGIPFLATTFSTLLGLTFTAFAIIGAFMTNTPKDFLGTGTYETFIDIFKATMLFQVMALILSIFEYFIFGTMYFVPILYLLITFIIISLGFFTFLVDKTFKIFKMNRKNLLLSH